MAEINQKIFKEAYVEELRAKVLNGQSINDYYSESFSYPEEMVWPTGIIVDDSKLDLKILDSGNQADTDLENAKKIYETFKMPKTAGELSTESEEPKSIKEFILSHWFVGGNDRSLRRHAIARLWWAAHLTVSPWEKDPVFYQGVKFKTDDSYLFTKILFSTQDVFQQVLERSLGRDSRILIPVLAYIEESGPLTREQIRDLIKELNLALCIRNITLMNFNEIKEFISEIAKEILLPNKV